MSAPKRRLDPVKRTEAVVRMRGEGWSFRKIAAFLSVSVGTVHRDLSLYAEQQAEQMIAAVQSGVQSGPESSAQLNTGLNGWQS
jgi:DNA-binding NarL/FixJ family response regulator